MNLTLTSDIVLFRRIDNDVQVLLIKRARDPFAGMWALPGGKMDSTDNTLEHTATRECMEETLIQISTNDLHLVGEYSLNGRDPRQHTPRAGEQPSRYVSIAYWAEVEPDAVVPAGDDASDARWFPIGSCMSGAMQLAFDHREIIADAFVRYGEMQADRRTGGRRHSGSNGVQ